MPAARHEPSPELEDLMDRIRARRAQLAVLRAETAETRRELHALVRRCGLGPRGLARELRVSPTTAADLLSEAGNGGVRRASRAWAGRR